MKKLWMVIGMVAVVAAVASAQVNSVNVAGVNSVGVPGDASNATFYLVGINLDAIDPADANITSIFADQLTGAPVPSAADQVWLWDSISQQYEYYGVDAVGNFRDASGYPSPWNDGVVDAPIGAGDGLWLVIPGGHVGQQVTITGQAVAADVGTVDITNNFNLISYPLSASINLQDTDFVNDGATKAPVPSAADQIWLWNAASQQYEYYGLSTDNTWHDASGYPTPWQDPAPTDVVIDLGEGFFYVHNGGGFTWTEANPYKENL